jgi:hypothetical protein
MRRAGIAVLTMAALALAISAPAGAESIAPEFGRCVKAPKNETGGGYSDSHCNQPVGSGATYHWLAGPGAKAGFHASTGSVALTLNAGGGRAQPAIRCSGSTTTGEFTSAATESLELVMTGCRMGAAGCQSEGAGAEEVAFSPLEGVPEVIRTTQQGEAVVRWAPAIGEVLASFECASTGVTITQSMLHVVRDDKSSKAEPEKFRVYKSGTQKPECAEPCEPNEEPSTSIGGAPGALSGFAMVGSQTNEEGIELRTFM